MKSITVHGMKHIILQKKDKGIMKAKSNIVLSIFTLTMMMLVSCENLPWRTYSMKIKNLSGNAVYVYPALGGEKGVIFPDTMLPNDKPYLYFIDAGNKISLSSDIPWEESLKKLPLDTLSVFYFTPDVIDTNSWDEIRDNNMVLKRKDISLEELKQNDFTITYP